MTPLIVWTLVVAGIWWLFHALRHRDPPPPSPWSTPGYRGGLRRRLIASNLEKAP